MNYAIVDAQGNVLNIVLWDGTSKFDVSPNNLIPTNDNPNAQTGGTYLNGVFSPPPVTGP